MCNQGDNTEVKVYVINPNSSNQHMMSINKESPGDSENYSDLVQDNCGYLKF